MHALIMGQSRRVPIVQMGLAEHALAIRTSVSLCRRRSPEVDRHCAEYCSEVVRLAMKVLAVHTLMDWMPMGRSPVVWRMCR